MCACALLAFGSCKKNEPIDEAKAGGKSTADFPQITADVFKPMDGGIVYGKPSGVLGFRLFPNPDFNEEARKKWNGDRFMNDPTKRFRSQCASGIQNAHLHDLTADSRNSNRVS